MNQTHLIIELTYQALMLVLILSMPAVIVAALVGLVVSIFQTITQIQDQSISTAIKLVAVIVTIALSASWGGGELLNYAHKLFDLVEHVGRQS